jgi:hypothetical protein
MFEVFILNVFYLLFFLKKLVKWTRADQMRRPHWAHLLPVGQNQTHSSAQPTQTDKKRTKAASVWVGALELPLHEEFCDA